MHNNDDAVLFMEETALVYTLYITRWSTGRRTNRNREGFCDAEVNGC